MPDDQFWDLIALIEGSKWDDATSDLTPLVDALARLDAHDIEAFYETLAQKAYAIDTREHYRAGGFWPGESDPFLYCRLSVIAMGKDFYQKVLRDPGEFPVSISTWNEMMLYVADEAYKRVTGHDFDRESSVDIESFSNTLGWR